MERKEWIDGCRRLFTRLVRTTVWADFVFPTGGKSDRQLGMCFDGLCREVVSVSAERLSDFCICQTYAISGYDTAYRRKWNVSHSFGKKAIGRYLRSGKERRYREDRWLKSFGLSRHDLARAVEDRRSHPFGRFIYSGIRGDDQAATALHRSGISRLCALHADVDAFLPVMLKMCESGAMPQKDTGALSGTVPYPL